MNTRHTGVITALLLTAALFLCMPGLMRSFAPADLNRMDQRLRPPKMHTMSVWLLPGETGDQRLISKACSAFEKAHPGVRIFLRTADAQELFAPDAVLPDAVLFDTGGVNMPDQIFVPLAGEEESSGMYAGVRYALPLWLNPNVLSIPSAWLGEEKAQSGPSLLATSAPAPMLADAGVLSSAQLPWDRLLQPGAVQCGDGVGLEQLLCMCPYPSRAALVTAASRPPAQPCAKVMALGEHLRAVRDGQAQLGCVLTPAVCDRVRYAALCRDTQQGRDFLTFLHTSIAQEALAAGFIPLGAEGEPGDELTHQAAELFGGVTTLPNAFAHTREELQALCRDSFQRLLDPVETLLKLR